MARSYTQKLQDYSFSEGVNPVFDFSSSPEKRLLCAILTQALHDVGRGVGERVGSARYYKACEALKWIKADFDRVVVPDKYRQSGHMGINWIFVEVFGYGSKGVKEAYMKKVDELGFVDQGSRLKKYGRPRKWS